MTEMTCVSPEGRITPGCPGLWNDEQRDAWQRVVDFVHEQDDGPDRHPARPLRSQGLDQADVGGHGRAARRGQLGGHRPVAAALRRGLPPASRGHPRRPRRGGGASSSAPRAARSRPASTWSRCTPPTATCSRRSCRPSPTSAPTSTAGRWRTGSASRSRSSTPCAPRCPDAVPVTVRISATDWLPDGNTEHDAVEIARAFIEHGAAAIDVSSGQVSKDEKPAFGRSYQTPFADRIRHEVADAGRRAGDRGRRDLVVRRRQLDPAGRPRRPVRPRPRPPLRPACGRCTRRPSRTTAAAAPSGRCRGRRVVGGRPPRAPTRSRRGCRCCATREAPPVHVRWRPDTTPATAKVG